MKTKERIGCTYQRIRLLRQGEQERLVCMRECRVTRLCAASTCRRRCQDRCISLLLITPAQGALNVPRSRQYGRSGAVWRYLAGSAAACSEFSRSPEVGQERGSGRGNRSQTPCSGGWGGRE
jgi:hypothetical protein